MGDGTGVGDDDYWRRFIIDDEKPENVLFSDIHIKANVETKKLNTFYSVSPNLKIDFKNKFCLNN